MPPPHESNRLTATSIVVATEDQVSSDLAGETVLLSLRSAMYYGLDDVGSRIWELVSAPRRVSEICETIEQEYDVTAERCRADVLRFLRELAVRELIEVRSGT